MKKLILLAALVMTSQGIAGEYLVKYKSASALRALTLQASQKSSQFRITDHHETGSLIKVNIPKAQEAKALASLVGRQDVEYVVPNAKVRAFSAPIEASALKEQWAIAKIQAEKAWQRAGNKGNRNVIVAVIDTGVALIISDRVFPPSRNGGLAEELKPLQCLLLGVFQSLALIPGVSRSAATILGGMGLGLSRKEAAEFSFFLAVPTLGAAGLYKLFKMLRDPLVTLPEDAGLLLMVGSFVAFGVALLAIKFFISLLQKFGFGVYGYYRILIGGLILILLSQNRL